MKKTLHLDSASEALKILRKERKAQRDKEVTEEVQRQLKETGVTKSETGGPSGASLSDEAFLEKYSKGESDDHARAKKILKELK